MSLLVRSSTPAKPTRRAYQDVPPVPRPSQASGTPYAYVPEDALKIAAVTACVGLRAGALAQMPIKAYTDSGSSATLLSTQPVLFTQPSSVKSVVPSVWKTQMSISRDLWGFAAGHITAVDGAGYTAHVEWYPPDAVNARQARLGEPLDWRINGQPVDDSLIFHVPSRWVVPGNPLGMSPLENSGLVDLARRCQEFGRNWFANGAIPSAILYSDTTLDSDQADTLLDKMLSRWRSRQPAVLGSGLKYEAVSVKANESQFLETATRVAADIAISFNMPPERIGAAIAGPSITYANRDQSQQQYLVDSINPDLVVIQETFTRYMAPGTVPRWTTAALLRSDLKTRYEAALLGIRGQFLHPDEVRALEDLPPLTPDQLATMPKVSGGPTPGGTTNE